MAYALVGAPTTRIKSISKAEDELQRVQEKVEKAKLAAYAKVPAELGTFLTRFPDVRSFLETILANVTRTAPATAAAAPAAAPAAAASGGIFAGVKSFFGFRRGPTHRIHPERKTRRNNRRN